MKNKNGFARNMRHSMLDIPICMAILATGTHLWTNYDYNKKYNIASSYAAKRVGDCEFPLTGEESENWWRVDLEVDVSKEDARPKRSKLKDYIKRCEAEASSQPTDLR